MRKPKILLLDEPFGALDPGIRADIHVLVRKMWNENELTIVMVTHDLSEAFRLGTRVIAFERHRNLPEEQQRYGATLSSDLPVRSASHGTSRGAVVSQDLEVWPRKIAGAPQA